MSNTAGINTAALHQAQQAHTEKVNPAIIMVVILLTMAVVAVLVGVVWVYFNSYLANLRAEKVENTVTYRDYAARRAADDSRLSTYGWVNADEGTVHIPVELAMDRMLTDAEGGRGQNSRNQSNAGGNAGE